MKKTISDKAIEAINQINKTALLMHRQMKSGEFNKPLADKAYLSTHRKIKTWRNSLFASFDDIDQLTDFHRSGLERELDTANERFGRVLKHYAQAVGVAFSGNGKLKA